MIVPLALARLVPLLWLVPPRGIAWLLVRSALVFLALALVLPQSSSLPNGDLTWKLLALGRELVVGLTLALTAAVPLAAAEAAGALVDHTRRPRGPSQDGEEVLFQQVQVGLGLALFGALGGPRLWLTALGESYVTLPIGHAPAVAATPHVIDAVGRLISLGITLAAPVLLGLLTAQLLVVLILRAAAWPRVGDPHLLRQVSTALLIACGCAFAWAPLKASITALGQSMAHLIAALAHTQPR